MALAGGGATTRLDVEPEIGVLVDGAVCAAAVVRGAAFLCVEVGGCGVDGVG